MPTMIRHPQPYRALVVTAAVLALLLGSDITARSAGDLQSRITATRSAGAALQSQIVAETTRIRTTTNGLQQAERRLTTIQASLAARVARLRAVQSALLAARAHLIELENHLHAASSALSANLVASYEGSQPDLTTAILESHGFSDLLEQISFMQRAARQDAQIVGTTRVARLQVSSQATGLASLESRDRSLALDVLRQRNEVAALKAALLRRQLDQVGARAGKSAALGALRERLKKLESTAAAQATRAAATGNAGVGGLAVDTTGMVQPPAGAPPAVAQVIAAANAIATLPYIFGGGHASFHANGYDCSGSVSYALAAAGLVSSPMVSGAFESWGEPGPGRWITIYANAGHIWMDVAGWRFDTVALAESGTRWSRGGGEFSGFVVRHPAGL
jgi:cell wall-associated NlpC family hydrolase